MIKVPNHNNNKILQHLGRPVTAADAEQAVSTGRMVVGWDNSDDDDPVRYIGFLQGIQVDNTGKMFSILEKQTKYKFTILTIDGYRFGVDNAVFANTECLPKVVTECPLNIGTLTGYVQNGNAYVAVKGESDIPVSVENLAFVSDIKFGIAEEGSDV